MDPGRLNRLQPATLVRALNRRYNALRTDSGYNDEGVSIFDEDWDNLVILDAARFDHFEELCDIDGELEHRTSRGSTSKQFVRGNFRADQLDTVYVSANFWYAQLADELGDVHRFVKTERDALGGMTSTPETVTAKAKDVAASHPRKRLIVHYMQPHQPYLAGRGKTFDHGSSLEVTVSRNDLSERDVRAAYRDNLRLVLEEAAQLVDFLPGKTVVTADHGELINDREAPIPIRGYGHPESIFVEELVKVPWLVVENGTRKDVSEARDAEPVDSDGVERNLRDLGYL